MTLWHERRGADPILRLGGLGLLGCAWLLGTGMTALIDGQAPHDATPLEMIVGMLMLAAGSLGATALLLGRHLFDRVQVSDRWIVRDTDRTQREAERRDQ